MICARRAVGILAFFAMFAVILVTGAPQASAEPEAMLDLAGCAANTVEPLAGDRLEFAEIGFSVAHADGGTDDDLTISDNGAVSFRFGLFYNGQYESVADLAGGNNEVIAPLWADVDLTAGGSITYGQTTYQGRPAFCVNWTDVEPRVNEKDVPPGLDLDNRPTNTFQLVLIERADRAAGDFDIMFNYSDVEWDDSQEPCQFFGEVGVEATIAAEAPSALVNDCCFQGDGEFCCQFDLETCCLEFDLCNDPLQAQATSAPVFVDGLAGLAGYAFSTLGLPVVLELPGSGAIDGMVAPNGLAQKSTNSIVPGRHIFSIESGNFPQGSTLSGTVTDSVTDAPLEGSRVSFCTNDNRCVGTSTGADGMYQIPGVPDAADHSLWVGSPPTGDYRSQTLPITVAGDTVVDVELVGPEPLVPGIGIIPSRNGATSTPSVYYGAPFELTAEGCADGVASYALEGRGGIIASGPMTYSAGLYRATVPVLRPDHGDAQFIILITCPDASEELYEFPIYIDPAGVVLDDYSGELIEGATVTLYAAELEVGPYLMVPDGDASVMDPQINVNNPSITLADGRFRWDTTTGWYYVEASKAGCDQVTGAMSSRSENVFVPPEVTDLELYLDCNNPPEVTVADASYEGNVLGGYSGPLPTPSISDPDDNYESVSNDAPAVLPVGDTTVNWTAVDSDDAVGVGLAIITVTDTTAPVVTGANVAATVPAAPGPVTFGATATDIVDGDVTPTCWPASGSMFDLGTTSVTCTATDAAGNSDDVTFDVTVTIEPPKCLGRSVTVDLGLGEMPTANNDVILGTAGPDVIDGLGGADVICGLGGGDEIMGGPGYDLIDAGAGADTVYGGGGNDSIWGGDGDDTIYGQFGGDTIRGGAGADLLLGGPGYDAIYGESGNDNMQGAGGNDRLWGGTGDDNMYGKPGDDVMFGQSGNDNMYAAGGDDLMYGGSGNDRMEGAGGEDEMYGGAGDDLMYGQNNNDIIVASDGDDFLYAAGGNDELDGGPGDDNLQAGSGNDQLNGGPDNDILYGQAGFDDIDGGPGVDNCIGGPPQDTLANC